MSRHSKKKRNLKKPSQQYAFEMDSEGLPIWEKEVFQKKYSVRNRLVGSKDVRTLLTTSIRKGEEKKYDKVYKSCVRKNNQRKKAEEEKKKEEVARLAEVERQQKEELCTEEEKRHAERAAELEAKAKKQL